MTAKYLHGEIREKGGAYGGGARMGGGGLFSFYSYRWAAVYCEGRTFGRNSSFVKHLILTLET